MNLASFACHPANSRGRLHDEDDRVTRGQRDAFQRDRDRIIHSVPFRRLRGKTQVFVAPDGDHFRVRLTHSLEVAQIGRAIARTLGLNEDLTEALCLAHDLGHPPFGHAGEDALEAAMAPAGGFDHNAHTLRVLTRLETPYPRFAGYNLSWETLEGLAKHNGPITRPTWALAEVDAAFALDLTNWPSLEAQVAAIADDIAYDNHDIDDGLRAGLLSLDQVLAVPLTRRCWDEVCARFPDVPPDRLVGELIRHQIGVMVNDLLDETRRRLAEDRPATVVDVRAAGRPLACFSDSLAPQERALKRFLYANMYDSADVTAIKHASRNVVTNLFAAYHADPGLLPPDRRPVKGDQTAVLRAIGDYIAGMTDRFAITAHERLIGPAHMPAGF